MSASPSRCRPRVSTAGYGGGGDRGEQRPGAGPSSTTTPSAAAHSPPRPARPAGRRASRRAPPSRPSGPPGPGSTVSVPKAKRRPSMPHRLCVRAERPIGTWAGRAFPESRRGGSGLSVLSSTDSPAGASAATRLGNSAASAAAAWTRGRASRAPLPSPTVTPWSSSGVSAIRSSAFAWAGSPLAWPASHQSGARNATRWPTSAHAAETTPSRITGIRRTAACSRKPVIAARSAPPTVGEQLQLVAEDRAGPAQRVADRRALAHPRQVVDRPAAAPGDHRRVGAAQRGDQRRRRRWCRRRSDRPGPQVGAGVGLLVGDRHPERGTPARPPRAVSASSTSIRPRAAAHPVAHDVLGQQRRVAVQRQCRRPGPDTEPAGQHGGGALAVEHGAHEPCALPAGRADTPSSAMPWSPANSTTRGRSMGLTGTADCAAASHSPRSSSRPSDPGGTVSCSRRSSASRRTPPSGRSIRSEKSSRFSELIRRTVPAALRHTRAGLTAGDTPGPGPPLQPRRTTA